MSERMMLVLVFLGQQMTFLFREDRLCRVNWKLRKVNWKEICHGERLDDVLDIEKGRCDEDRNLGIVLVVVTLLR